MTATRSARSSRRTRSAVLGALLATGTLLLAACGSSSGSGSTGNGGSGNSASTPAQPAGLTVALQALEKNRRSRRRVRRSTQRSCRHPRLSSSSTTRRPSGRCRRPPRRSCRRHRPAGFSPKLLNGGANNTASQDIDLLEQAVNLHPKVVLQVGIITALDYTAYGKALAEYVAAQGPKNASVGVITSADIVPSTATLKAFQSELAKLCPGCTVFSQNVDTADWSTQITPTVTSILDAHPTLNYLFPIVDGMAPLVSPALSAVSGRNLQVISANATPGSAMNSVKSGQFAAEVGAPPQAIGWTGGGREPQCP